MMHPLAIVIPAYKLEYLDLALESVLRQTCLDFNLYVFDDNSPEDLESLVNNYACRFPIQFTRFDSNWGGKQLAKQWERCIDHTKGEQWIWLFSDDDIMDERCVELFYRQMQERPDVPLFHFDIDIIDKNEKVQKSCNRFGDLLQVDQYFYNRVNFLLNNAVVEFIFNRRLYDDLGGFVHRDLAWCSDDGTWIKFGYEKGIVTIPGARVKWRISDSNISSMNTDLSQITRKMEAGKEHLMWVRHFFAERSLVDRTTNFQKFKWLYAILSKNSMVSFREKFNLVRKVIGDLGYSDAFAQACLYFLFCEARLLGYRLMGRN